MDVVKLNVTNGFFKPRAGPSAVIPCQPETMWSIVKKLYSVGINGTNQTLYKIGVLN